jgi:hypothetical protein
VEQPVLQARPFTGDPGRIRPIDRARDEDLARRLWQVSEHMTGVRYTALEG